MITAIMYCDVLLTNVPFGIM